MSRQNDISISATSCGHSLKTLFSSECLFFLYTEAYSSDL